MDIIETEHGIFSGNEYTQQTAQEVYDEWLANKDKPQVKELTEIEKIKISQATQFETILELLGGM